MDIRTHSLSFSKYIVTPVLCYNTVWRDIDHLAMIHYIDDMLIGLGEEEAVSTWDAVGRHLPVC